MGPLSWDHISPCVYQASRFVFEMRVTLIKRPVQRRGTKFLYLVPTIPCVESSVSIVMQIKNVNSLSLTLVVAQKNLVPAPAAKASPIKCNSLKRECGNILQNWLSIKPSVLAMMFFKKEKTKKHHCRNCLEKHFYFLMLVGILS